MAEPNDYILNESTLYLVLDEGGRKTFVKSHRDKTKTPEEIIKDVKAKNRDREAIPRDNQPLLFRYQKDGRTLNKYSVPKESLLTLIPRLPITLQTHTGRRVAVMIWFDETVRELKAKIETKEGIPVDRQRLIHTGEELEDDKTLEDYSFSADSVVYMDFKGMKVFVTAGKHTTFSVHVKWCLKVVKEMHVFHLKSMIEHQKQVPIYLQTLIFEGMKLEDSKCLMEYNVLEKEHTSSYH